MTKQEMKTRLNEFVKEATCWNDVAFKFAEMILAKHLYIDPNSIDPTSPQNFQRINNPLLPQRFFVYLPNHSEHTGGRYLNGYSPNKKEIRKDI